MQEYFDGINIELNKAMLVANTARSLNLDPEPKVDIPIARNMAERVEGLISVVAPGLSGSNMTKRIEELEMQYGVSAWEVSLIIAEEVAKEKFCKFKDKKEAIEIGIRVGMAYSTAGIVAAPLEGFIEIRIKKRKDNQDYMSIIYAGPIRGAGGTAAALSVIIADYVRKKMGLMAYDPTEIEVKRYVTEVRDYHERITNLQYNPSEDEISFLASHIPVEINGDPTEKLSVSNYKNLDRVETDLIRGGVCLVLAEGIAQKAPKLWKRLSRWGKKFDLDWEFLEEFLELQKTKKAQKTIKEKKNELISPNYTFIKDLVAGRPILTYPMRDGGFRLRYGRCRVSGYSAASIHPATMAVLDKYIAVGTQLKVERPGKAAAITACDDIDGPIVKLKDGSVIKVEKFDQLRNTEIEEIIFLGDILFNYGDFSENGHKLVPAGYCSEWWAMELEKASVNLFGNIDSFKLSEVTGVEENLIDKLLHKPTKTQISCSDSIKIATKLRIPLHPDHTFYYKSITKEQLVSLRNSLKSSNIIKQEQVEKIVCKLNESKRALELIGAPHTVVAKEYVVIEKDIAIALHATLALDKDEELIEGTNLEALEKISGMIIRDKSGTFIGARMGRPEKAKMRKLIGSPQMLFPVGKEGGRMRSIQASLEKGAITSDLPTYLCNSCKHESVYKTCELCGIKTELKYYCKVCGIIDKEECEHGKAATHRTKQIDVKSYFEKALLKMKVKNYPDLIKGVKGNMNKDKIPEHIGKGILRAINSIYVNKDGTTRYDMTELPMTHFKPIEIKTSVSKLIELGYTHDIHGNPLENPNQIIELKPQDLVLPGNANSMEESADDVLFRVAKFVDDELVKLYDAKAYYNLSQKEELVGHLVIGLAPHISAGMIGRIIGFSQTQGCFAHPLWHAALRRDCDGDECCVMLLMDAFLNFSRQFLPDRRGARTMDAPLVLTSEIIPSEVDNMAHGVDVLWRYPLELYEAAMCYKGTGEIKIEQIAHRLNTDGQYERMGFTHDVSSINMGVMCSAYKSLPSMEEKLRGQMSIAERIRAVDESDVAKLVIEKHFLKDIKGNLRKFFHQQFRCVECNEKYRRPPLLGKCSVCGGKIILTVSEGSIIKYLEPSLSLSRKYKIPVYLKQTLELTERMVVDVFGKEKEKQAGLGSWFG